MHGLLGLLIVLQVAPDLSVGEISVTEAGGTVEYAVALDTTQPVAVSTSVCVYFDSGTSPSGIPNEIFVLEPFASRSEVHGVVYGIDDGIRLFWAAADCGGAIEELDEANNVLASEYCIHNLKPAQSKSECFADYQGRYWPPKTRGEVDDTGSDAAEPIEKGYESTEAGVAESAGGCLAAGRTCRRSEPGLLVLLALAVIVGVVRQRGVRPEQDEPRQIPAEGLHPASPRRHLRASCRQAPPVQPRS